MLIHKMGSNLTSLPPPMSLLSKLQRIRQMLLNILYSRLGFMGSERTETLTASTFGEEVKKIMTTFGSRLWFLGIPE